ncbi:MAG: ArsA family ATPase [Chloroflexi bacterium]|nr:ArsA family ATPase [Chloroflexota bacterium]
MRTILYTGKGGVGKTSVAAATALRSAQLGHPTVVISTDAAHSLSDSLDQALGPEPVKVAERLWGQEVNVLREMERRWDTVQSWLSALLSWRGMNEVVAEELAVLPGMEELASLLYITEYYDRGDFEVLVVDCAPTAETLRLLSFPDVARWWMERLLPIERSVARVLRPIVQPMTGIPFPEDAVFKSVRDLFRQVERMRGILDNPDESSVRLVMNPEKMVIKETQRTFTYLNLYGYSTDLVVCNRLIPPGVEDPYFAAWKESQARYFHLIEEGFRPVPIRQVPLFDQEVVGTAMLERMASVLFPDEDPTAVYFKGKAHTIRKDGGRYSMTVQLPFVSKEQISVLRTGDEVVVQAGSHRRNIVLPRTLAGREVLEAKFEEGGLRITFGGDPAKARR